MFPKLVAFDVDNTLTESKQPMSPAMTHLMEALLTRTKVAITSGAKFTLAKEQVADRVAQELRKNLYMLPTSGAALYQYDGNEWTTVYKEIISPEELERITEALTRAGIETGIVDFSAPSYGDRIEYRDSQVALSPLGQQAPVEEKRGWDPDRSKRIRLRDAVATLLPEYEVKTGGWTTIDVTKPGVNKAYGMRKLSGHINIPISDMVYVGDALFPGGNDEVVKETGIKTIAVKDAQETEKVIADILA